MNTLTKLTVAVSLGLMSNAASATTVLADFVDAGTFSVVKFGNGSVAQSEHFLSKNGSGDHQFTLVGAQSTMAFINTRQGYYAFDLSTVTEEVTSATLRIWGFAENNDEIIAGVMRSDDNSETLLLKSVDNFTANEIINSPLGDLRNHTLDVPIWEDLGDGTVYGSRVITEADEDNPGLIPNPISSTTDCSNPSPGQACGRWFDIDMTAALADINAETGIFIFGTSVADLSPLAPGVNGTQQMTGGAIDLSLAHLQDFRSPTPQLELTVVPVPAAVWLFGSGLLGLVAVARRRGMVNS